MSQSRQGRRQRAIELLLQGLSNAEVAAELGCNPSTVWRWARQPEFVASLRDARRERRKHVGAVLRAGATRAARYLASVVDDEDVPPAVRVRASMDLLDRAGLDVPDPEPASPKTTKAEMLKWIEKRVAPYDLADMLRRQGFTVERENAA